jgi:uncharacterized membrane protein
MALRDHPVHIMAIHFPTALLTMDIVFAAIAGYTGKAELYTVAYYCLMAGVISGWLAALAGLYDWLTRLLPRKMSQKQVFIHAGLQAFTVTGFTVILSMEFHHPDWIAAISPGLWAAKLLLLVVLIAGSYMGGEVMVKLFEKTST